jgi:hypothetical protein
MVAAKSVSPNSTITGVQLGLVLILLSMMGGGVGAGFTFYNSLRGMISAEIAPVKEAQIEMKKDLKELRDRPVPQLVLDRFEALSKRLDHLESKE